MASYLHFCLTIFRWS